MICKTLTSASNSRELCAMVISCIKLEEYLNDLFKINYSLINNLGQKVLRASYISMENIIFIHIILQLSFLFHWILIYLMKKTH